MIRQTTITPEPVSHFSDETRTPVHDETVPIAVSANELLQQRVRLFLMGSNLPGLRHIEVEVHGDTVILRGAVRTFYEKQLAVRLSRRVAGVIHVVDSIDAWGYSPRAERHGADHRPAAHNPLHAR